MAANLIPHEWVEIALKHNVSLTDLHYWVQGVIRTQAMAGYSHAKLAVDDAERATGIPRDVIWHLAFPWPPAEPAEPEAPEQGSWRDRPPML